jgi:hypothetical protein
MAVTQESIQNFRRARNGDAFLGIQNLNTQEIHLALCWPRDAGIYNPPMSQHSWIGRQRIDPLPGAGGHSQLAQYAGVPGARQIGPRQAAGDAVGFSIIKRSHNEYEIGTWIAGLNGQYPDTRAPGVHQQDPWPRELGLDFRGPIIRDLDIAMLPLKRFSNTRNWFSITLRRVFPKR